MSPSTVRPSRWRTVWPTPRTPAEPSPSCSTAWPPQSTCGSTACSSAMARTASPPNEFDITEMLHDGENVVAVACYEYSSASWLEDQDFWRLHGLFRSVELAAQPHVHIENMQIESDWDPESGSASLDAALTVRNAADAATISATLKNSDGNVVWETANCADPDTSISTGSLNGIHPWSAEDPVSTSSRSRSSTMPATSPRSPSRRSDSAASASRTAS